MTGPGIFKRIIQVVQRDPDRRHDTRHLECGHKVIVPRARLHPMTSRCRKCEGE